KLGADLLILLSDVDGLYTSNPSRDKSAKHICEIKDITTEIVKMAGDALSSVGSGGMKTKIEAAKIAVNAGATCVITNGNLSNPLKNLESGKVKYSVFISKTNPLTARKKWIVSGVKPMGKIIVDAGAEKALIKGSSLLPAGAIRITGEFERGDLVII